LNKVIKNIGLWRDLLCPLFSFFRERFRYRPRTKRGAGNGPETMRQNVGGETEKEILAILEEAIRREQAAWQLYSRGASLAGKDEVRRIFVMLAQEEQGHEQLLKKVFYDYKKRLGLKVMQPEKDDVSDDATD